jgi:hypothetical protein
MPMRTSTMIKMIGAHGGPSDVTGVVVSAGSGEPGGVGAPDPDVPSDPLGTSVAPRTDSPGDPNAADWPGAGVDFDEPPRVGVAAGFAVGDATARLKAAVTLCVVSIVRVQAGP